MPTPSATPPPANPGASNPQDGAQPLALFVAQTSLLALCCLAGAVFIYLCWGPLWLNVLHVAVAALWLLVVARLWPQPVKLIAVLSLTAILGLGSCAWLLRSKQLVLETENQTLRRASPSRVESPPPARVVDSPPPQPRSACELSPEALAGISLAAKTAAAESVKSVLEEQLNQRKQLEMARADFEIVKQGCIGLQRDLQKTAKSTELAPVASSLAKALEGIDSALKIQYIQGKTLTGINAACQKK